MTDDWRATPSRSPKRHELKCWPPYFAAILSGEKRFEIRWDDRGYRAGDTLHLREYLKADGTYTGRTIDVEVTYLLGGSFTGLDRGFVVMSIAIRDLCGERAEMIALLEERITEAPWPGSYCTYPLVEACAWQGARHEPCWQHRRLAMLERLRVAVKLPGSV